VALLRCVCHTLDLCIIDYVKHYELEEKIIKLSKANNTTAKLCVTRWTSFAAVLKELLEKGKLSDDLKCDYEIIKAVTETITIV
jgi:hypothetical protein